MPWRLKIHSIFSMGSSDISQPHRSSSYIYIGSPFFIKEIYNNQQQTTIVLARLQHPQHHQKTRCYIGVKGVDIQVSRALLLYKIYKKNKGRDRSPTVTELGEIYTCCVSADERHRVTLSICFCRPPDDDTGAPQSQHQRDFDDVEMSAPQLTNKQHGDFASPFIFIRMKHHQYIDR